MSTALALLHTASCYTLNIMNLCCTILLAIAFAFWLGNVIASSPENANADELKQRRELLRNMTKEVWQAFVKEEQILANGSSSKKVLPGKKHLVIVDTMATLWTMELKEEFAQGREFISNLVNLSQANAQWDMKDFVGGLLSCYALTNDTIFRDKAFEIASARQSRYDNQTGIANFLFVPKTGEPSKTYGLSQISGDMLEERYLHSLAPEQFVDRTSLWRAFLRNNTDSSNRALFSGFNSATGNFSDDKLSLSTQFTQHFYANLVKGCAQSNGTDLEAIEMFVNAIEIAVQMGMITQANGTELIYIRDYRTDTKEFNNFMHFDGCVFGALFRIGADALEAIRERNQTIASKTVSQLSKSITQHRKLAEQITETCHFAANHTAAKLLYYRLYLNEQDRVENEPMNLRRRYRFNSGLEESYFVLWRATKDQKYRDYAWELTQAYKRGLTTSQNKLNYVLRTRSIQYLYLTFTEDTVLPLDQWVFSPRRHPLPICGHNGANPKC